MKVTILQLNSVWGNPDETFIYYQKCGVQGLLRNPLVLLRMKMNVNHYHG